MEWGRIGQDGDGSGLERGGMRQRGGWDGMGWDMGGRSRRGRGMMGWDWLGWGGAWIEWGVVPWYGVLCGVGTG